MDLSHILLETGVSGIATAAAGFFQKVIDLDPIDWGLGVDWRLLCDLNSIHCDLEGDWRLLCNFDEDWVLKYPDQDGEKLNANDTLWEDKTICPNDSSSVGMETVSMESQLRTGTASDTSPAVVEQTSDNPVNAITSSDNSPASTERTGDNNPVVAATARQNSPVDTESTSSKDPLSTGTINDNGETKTVPLYRSILMAEFSLHQKTMDESEKLPTVAPTLC